MPTWNGMSVIDLVEHHYIMHVWVHVLFIWHPNNHTCYDLKTIKKKNTICSTIPQRCYARSIRFLPEQNNLIWIIIYYLYWGFYNIIHNHNSTKFWIQIYIHINIYILLFLLEGDIHCYWFTLNYTKYSCYKDELSSKVFSYLLQSIHHHHDAWTSATA